MASAVARVTVLLDFRFLFVYHPGVISSADARTAVAVPCARSAFAPVELPPDLAPGVLDA